MKNRRPNNILNIVIAIVIMSVQSACATTTSVPPTETPFEDTSTPEPNSTPTDTPTPEATPTEEPTSFEPPSNSPIPIMVMPFYDVEGLYIDVGNYSEELKTSDLNKLTLLAEEMARQKSSLTPEQMFVLSIRLHDLGDKDNSVYWFYEARFRQLVFEKSLDPNHIGLIGDPSFELPAAYNAFSELAGEYINAYAGCDLDNWINIVQTVKENNPEPPDLEKLFPGVVFIERNQWEQINNNVGAGLDEMANYISENREEIVKIRAENDLDAQFCESDK